MGTAASQRVLATLQSDFRAPQVWSKFAVWLLSDPTDGVSRYAYSPGHRQAIENVCRLHTQNNDRRSDWESAQEFALKHTKTAPPRMAIERAATWAAEFAGDCSAVVAAVAATPTMPTDPAQLQRLIDAAGLCITYGAQAGHNARAYRTACCPAEFHEILAEVRKNAETTAYDRIEQKLNELLSTY